jgi:hypothetical protein
VADILRFLRTTSPVWKAVSSTRPLAAVEKPDMSPSLIVIWGREFPANPTIEVGFVPPVEVNVGLIISKFAEFEKIMMLPALDPLTKNVWF